MNNTYQYTYTLSCVIDACLLGVSPKAETEIRTLVQLLYLRRDPRKRRAGEAEGEWRGYCWEHAGVSSMAGLFCERLVECEERVCVRMWIPALCLTLRILYCSTSPNSSSPSVAECQGHPASSTTNEYTFEAPLSLWAPSLLDSLPAIFSTVSAFWWGWKKSRIFRYFGSFPL